MLALTASGLLCQTWQDFEGPGWWREWPTGWEGIDEPEHEAKKEHAKKVKTREM